MIPQTFHLTLQRNTLLLVTIGLILSGTMLFTAGRLSLPPEPVRTENECAPVSAIDYQVQVGLFMQQENALQLHDRLHLKGHTPHLFQFRDSDNRNWYSVRIGGMANREAAVAAASRISQSEGVSALVVAAGDSGRKQEP